MIMTRKEAMTAALDAWFFKNSGIGLTKQAWLMSDMESAILAYIEVRGLVLVPKDATDFMLSTGRMDQHDWSLVLAAAPDPFGTDTGEGK